MGVGRTPESNLLHDLYFESLLYGGLVYANFTGRFCFIHAPSKHQHKSNVYTESKCMD